MESNLHLQIKCAPRASRPRLLEPGPLQGTRGRQGWIIVMKRRWTGWLPRAARVKSSGGFCCVNCALVIHCSPPFHVVSRYHRAPEILPCRGSEPPPPPLRQTINGSFAENGMAIDCFGERLAKDLVSLLVGNRRVG